MTKTDMIIKSMGITAYLDMMEKEAQKKIGFCNSQLDYFATELVKIRNKKKKKFFSAEKIYEDDLNLYASELAKFQEALKNIREMTQKLNEILAENEGKEDIEDGIFDGLFKLSKV